ncbi:MAG: arginine--tRNA ligase [Anaerolineaceae bacterium]|nr:arginine--tRNA ligase [Anaerolineaceae bacterium]
MIVLPAAHARLVEEALAAATAAAALPSCEWPAVEIRPAARPELGDYASAIALQLARPMRRKPLDIARAIADHLPPAPFLASVEVAPPGFLNFRLDEAWLCGQVEEILREGDTLGSVGTGAGQRALVEFVSANPTGPLHIGRSRGAIVGDALARLLHAAGYEVEREYYFNNAGRQMQMLGESLRLRYLQALGRQVDLPDEDFYHGDYLVQMARDLVARHGDALAKDRRIRFQQYAEAQIFEEIRRTLERIDIRHDRFFNEHSLYENGALEHVLGDLQARGQLYEAAEWEGASEDEQERARRRAPATWFRASNFGVDKDHVLLRSDGTPTYTLPDVAYHRDKLARGYDLAVNIFGADHYVQHQVVRAALDALGEDSSRLRVVILQFVRLMQGGMERKMSTRRGDYETLDDLIDETGPDAVRYLLLARSADARLDFDLDLAVAQNNDNPVYYIQNAHVRCAGILRRADAAGMDDSGADLSLLGAAERHFLRKALELPAVIEQAALELEAHRLAFYAHELATIFHPLYEYVRVLGEDVPPELAAARLRFYRAAQLVFRRVLALTGMNAPETM